MIDTIRKILSSEDCYMNRLNCIYDRTCTDCENEQLTKLIAKHDYELLDKVMQKQRTIIDDDGLMHRVVFVKDIEEMKAEVEEC